MVQPIFRALHFLRAWWERLRGGLKNLGDVAPDEELRLKVNQLAIGLNERKKVSGEPPRAKLKNFKPRSYEGRLELSTYCMDALRESERWALLDTHCDRDRVAGRSEFNKATVRLHGLQVDPNWVPLRHVDVVEWPADEIEQTNAAQALYAAQICTLRG